MIPRRDQAILKDFQVLILISLKVLPLKQHVILAYIHVMVFLLDTYFELRQDLTQFYPLNLWEWFFVILNTIHDHKIPNIPSQYQSNFNLKE